MKMLIMRARSTGAVFFAGAALLAGCRAEPSPATNEPDAVALAPPKPRFDPAAIEAMKAQLLAEPKIKDVLFQPSRLGVEWQVAVPDDGSSRIGYAGYVCSRLRERGLVDPDTDVRVVDMARIAGGDLRAASLGHVDCTTERDLGI